MQITTEATIRSGLPVEIVARTCPVDGVEILEINWRGGRAIPAHMESAITGAEWGALYERAGEALAGY